MNTAQHSTKVYIVDDSIVIRERLVEMIEAMPNVEVVGQAESAQAAIDGIHDTNPDCVVLDMQLLDSNGLTVLREVHPTLPQVMFVVLTNHASTQYCRLCMEAGASYFFDKTSDTDRIRDVIASVMPQTTH
ncbi:MAG: response regulator transcription factor [Burkholderiales bacterium]|nr:response regulator transcription factor [Burkholderiales bacterium]